MSDTHDPMAAVSKAEALERVRLAHQDRLLAEAAEEQAIDLARQVPGVTMDEIAREVGYADRHGLYYRLRTRKRA